MKLKRLLASILALAMVLSTMGFTVYADETTNVAKVGNTEYATIDEAIAAWTNGTTLTLLSDVQLSDVFKFPSTESRTLDLDTYTMTAASGKHAIEVVCNGQGAATYGLTVKADSEKPGGITATGQSCIYYKKSGTTKDRVIIRVDGGVFNGNYAINVYSSNSGTNCPQVSINGGTFNGNVSISKGKLIVAGGTFNGWVNCTGDSTAYRQISGGTFKQWQFMTADANNKFWVGTSQANYNVGTYVDDNGYLVVGGPVVTEPGETFEASSDNYSGWSNYLKYSSAATNSLYYTSVEEALADNNKATGSVTVYVDEIDMTDINYKGTIVVPEGETLSITNAPVGLKVIDTAGNELVAGGDGTYGPTPVVSTAKISNSQINNSDPAETFISCEITGLDKAPAKKSIVIKTYSGDTLIATTTCQKPEYYALATLGVKICTTGSSSSWKTVWEENMPRADFVPDKNVLYVDDVPVSEAAVPMITVSGEAAIEWGNVHGVNPVSAKPEGKLNAAYVSASYMNGVPAIWGQADGVVCTESFLVELYADGEKVGQVKLDDPNKEVIGKASSITWHAALTDDGDDYWVPEWEDGAINVNAIPDTAKLWIDGVEADTCEIELNVTDLHKPIFAAVTDENGKVESFVAGSGYLNGVGSNVPVYADAFNTAMAAANGKTITMLRDVTITEKLIVENNVTLDLNGKTITTSGIVGSRVIVLDGQCMEFVINANGGAINSADAKAYGIIDNEACANVTINGGTYDFDTDNGGLFKFRDNMGSFTLNDINVETNAQVSGPNGGSLQKLNVNGGTFKAANGYNVRNVFAFYVSNDAEATFENVTITNEYIGAIECYGGKVTVNDCNISVTGTNSAPYLSCAVAVSGDGEVTIDGGTYTTKPAAVSDANGQGNTHGSWTVMIMSSGGTMTINDGTFSNDVFEGTPSNPRAVISIGADAYYGSNIAANLQINGGTFNSIGALVDCETIWGSETNGKYNYMPTMDVAITDGDFTNVAGKTIGGCDPISTGNPVGIEITGGIYGANNSIDDSYLADGFELTDNGDGTFGVVEKAGLSGSGIAEDPFLIADLDDLKWFRDDVNAGNTYDGKYIKLTADIDLANEAWTPIGTSSNYFKGIFDGDNNTIYNLCINWSTDYVSGGNNQNYAGLFGYMKDGGRDSGIKNLTIENVDVSGCLYVGAVLGRGYTSGIIENCHVTGNVDIEGYSYIGGIVGRYEYSVDDNGVSIYNCSVKATTEEKGTISGIYEGATYVGGILGFTTEPSPKMYFEKLDVENVEVTGFSRVGGISGIAHQGNTYKDCSVSEASIYGTDTMVGLLVGACQGTESSPVTFKENNVDTETVTAKSGETEIKDLYGTNIDGGIPVTNFVAQIGSALYETLAEAINVAQDDDEVVILTAGTYKVPTGKNITITGAVDGVEFDMSSAVGVHASMTFNNVTFRYKNQDYTGLQHAGDMVYNDCTFYGQPFLYGTSETFNKCTFNQDSSDAYNVWTYGAKEVKFNECKFNSAGKSVLIYRESAPDFIANVEVVNCEFYATTSVEGKAAIEMDSSLFGGINLTITKAKVEGFGTGNVSGNNLWNNKKGNSTEENNDITVVVDGKTVLEPIRVPVTYEVATKAELKDALSKAEDGDIILLTADIDYGTEAIAKITKAITLDLGGKTLTTKGTYHGLSLDNDGIVVTNGKLNHAGTVAAIKVWNAKEISNLEIDVTGTSSNGNTIDGIVIQENAAGVDVIKNVTIHSTSGQGVSSGIKTYNCGNATEPVIGSMENVTVDAKDVGLNIYAPCGTATGCDIKGGISGVEIWIKGTYSASLALEKCTVEGGVQAVHAHDEYKDSAVNTGAITLVTDEDTTFVSENGAQVSIENQHGSEITIPEDLTKDAVAVINDIKYFTSLAKALNAAQVGDTVTLLENVTLDSMVTIPAGKTITLDLNGNTIDTNFTAVSGNDFAFCVAYGADLTIADSSEEKTGTIDGSKVQGAIKMTDANVSAENGTAKLTVDGGKLIGSYYGISGNGSRNGTEIVVNGGSIVANGGVTGVAGYPTGAMVGTGIFHPQNGTVTVNGGVISGPTGIEMRAGTLEVNDGTITATVKNTDDFRAIANGSGTTVYGAAIALSQHSTDQPTSVTVNGGTLNGIKAFYQTRLTGTPSVDVSATIVAGVTLNGAVEAAEDGYEMAEKADGSYVFAEISAAQIVAKIGDVGYESLEKALADAQDGETITLIWAEGDAPIAMNGSVCGNKTVTITGTADVDWSKGWLFVGRGSEGDGKLIFKDANLTSTEASLKNGSYGIHVSMFEYGESGKNNGEVVFENSNIDLSYLMGKNNVTVDGGKLTVWYGFAVGARPARETNNVQYTATMNVKNGAVVEVKNHNGMGIGYESNGVLNVESGSTFECAQDFLITANGTMNVNGGNLIVAKTITTNKNLFISGNSTVKIEDLSGRATIMDETTLTDSYIKSPTNGTTRVLGDLTLNGGFDAAYLMTAGSTTANGGYEGTITIEDGTTVNVSYGVEMNGNVTLNGGTIELSGGNVSGEIWGCVFQNGTFEINSNIVVDGNSDTAPIYFTNATATVNGNITQSKTGGEPIYVREGSTVTFGDDAVITTDCSVHVNGTLKSSGDVYGTITKADTAVIEISGGTYTQDVTDWCVDGYVCKDNTDGTYSVVKEAVYVAKVGDVEYTDLQAAREAAINGETIELIGDVVFDTDWSFGYYNYNYLIGKDASLKSDNGSRSTISYGNKINVEGNITDAKTADKTATKKSMDIVAGLSFNGDGGGTQLNVNNAYVSYGMSTSKSSGATGEFNFNFTNSIVEFTNNFVTALSSGDGLTPVYNIDVKDSVLTTASHMELWHAGTNMTVDNSNVTIGNSFANGGTLTVKNGSVMKVTNPIMSSHGGNTGTINVDGATLDLTGGNQAWVSEGAINLTADAKLKLDQFSNIGTITIDAAKLAAGTSVTVIDGTAKSGLTAESITLVNGDNVTVTVTDGDVILTKAEAQIAVAAIGDVKYTSLQAAVNEAKDGNIITVIADIENTENVTIDNKNIVIDLGEYTFNGAILPSTGNITIQNGSIVNTDSSMSALEINAGELTLTDVNIDSARHAVRIDGEVTAVIDGGTYRSAIGTGTGTYYAVNVSGNADVTINSGTFTGPKGTTADSGAAVNVQAGAKVTILDGTYTGGKVNTLASKGELTVSGGTYDQDPTAYVADGYKVNTNTDGTYSVVADNLIKFTSISSSLESSLALNIFLKASDLTGKDYYAVVKHTKGTGEVIETTIPYANWLTDRSEKVVKYTNIAAKQMADKIEVTIYNADGTQASETLETGLRMFALGYLNYFKNDESNLWLPALTDMLNYGAAAQKMFNYNTDDYANNGAEDFQKYASKDYSISDEGCTHSGTAKEISLTLEDMIKLNVYFGSVTEGMYATYSYTTHGGRKVNAEIPFTSFIKDGSMYGVSVEDIAIADADALVTVTMFNADGTEAGKVTYSITGYLYGMIKNGNNADLYPALAKFAASAKVAFAK